jgi:replicative DNA helicase
MKIKTDYTDLDQVLQNALNTPSFTVVGARCGVGKTAFLLNLCLGMADNLQDICFISLDSNAERIAERCALILSTWKAFAGNPGQCFENFEIMDKYISFDELLAFIEEKNTKDGVRIFYIDYLQLFNLSREEVYQESSYIAVSLKNLTTKLDITIIAASQLSRKPEERTGNRPRLTDLRDTGALEESADCVMLMLRREYYDPNDKPGECEIIVAKNRKGGTGSVTLTYVRDNNAFFNYKPVCYTSDPDEEAFIPYKITFD